MKLVQVTGRKAQPPAVPFSRGHEIPYCQLKPPFLPHFIASPYVHVDTAVPQTLQNNPSGEKGDSHDPIPRPLGLHPLRSSAIYAVCSS